MRKMIATALSSLFGLYGVASLIEAPAIASKWYGVYQAVSPYLTSAIIAWLLVFGSIIVVLYVNLVGPRHAPRDEELRDAIKSIAGVARSPAVSAVPAEPTAKIEQSYQSSNWVTASFDVPSPKPGSNCKARCEVRGRIIRVAYEIEYGRVTFFVRKLRHKFAESSQDIFGITTQEIGLHITEPDRRNSNTIQPGEWLCLDITSVTAPAGAFKASITIERSESPGCAATDRREYEWHLVEFQAIARALEFEKVGPHNSDDWQARFQELLQSIANFFGNSHRPALASVILNVQPDTGPVANGYTEEHIKRVRKLRSVRMKLSELIQSCD